MPRFADHTEVSGLASEWSNSSFCFRLKIQHNFFKRKSDASWLLDNSMGTINVQLEFNIHTNVVKCIFELVEHAIIWHYCSRNKQNILHVFILKYPLPLWAGLPLISLPQLVSCISFLRTCWAAQPLGLDHACLLCSTAEQRKTGKVQETFAMLVDLQ